MPLCATTRLLHTHYLTNWSWPHQLSLMESFSIPWGTRKEPPALFVGWRSCRACVKPMLMFDSKMFQLSARFLFASLAFWLSRIRTAQNASFVSGFACQQALSEDPRDSVFASMYLTPAHPLILYIIYRFWITTSFKWLSTLHVWQTGTPGFLLFKSGVQEMNLAWRLLTPFARGDHQQNGGFIALLRQIQKMRAFFESSSVWLVRWLQLLYNHGYDAL